MGSQKSISPEAPRAAVWISRHLGNPLPSLYAAVISRLLGRRG